MPTESNSPTAPYPSSDTRRSHHHQSMASNPGRTTRSRLRPTDRRDFGVGIACALPFEAQAVRGLFDCHWDDGQCSGQIPGDPNFYSLGAMGHHNVVLVYLPGVGKVNAAYATSFLRFNFPNIQLVLLVGTCVSEGVIQHDLGGQLTTGFERNASLLGSLGRPRPEIRSLLAKLKGFRGRYTLMKDIADHMADLRRELWSTPAFTSRPDVVKSTSPPLSAVHFGLFASGDAVIASKSLRDSLAAKEGVVAFDMEAAGVWEILPCVVIKGVSNHADNSKADKWQHYAAATAASCAKSFLSFWTPLSRDMSPMPLPTATKGIQSMVANVA